MIFKDCKEAVNYTNWLLINARKVVRYNLQKGMRQMGFFDNLKSSLAETGQDLSQKAKDTTEIFRLTNLNKTKEKEIEKVIYQIGSTYYANYRDECMEKMPELAAQIKSLQDEIAVNKEMIEKLSTEEICPQCGKKVNPGSKFCIYCGAALEAPTEQPEEKAEVKVCKSCGKPLEEGAVFCTNCGTKIEDDKATEEN